MKKKLSLICFALLCIVVLLWIFKNNIVYSECYIEAGTEFKVEDFLKIKSDKATFEDDSDKIDIYLPGDYVLKIKVGPFLCESNLHVVDSIAPAVKVQKVYLNINDTCVADDFILEITDMTKTEVTYVAEPDFTKPGSQMVELQIVDEGGNITKVSSELFVSAIKEEINIEVGEAAPTLEDFIIQGENVHFLTSVDELDYNRLGTYFVYISVDGHIYKSKLNVIDTVAPVLVLKNVEDYLFAAKAPEDFIELLEDKTGTTLTFVNEPDLSLAGMQEIEILAEDEGGNKTIQKAGLMLNEDKENPVIHGARDMIVIIGDMVSYKKGISVSDNCAEGTQLSVDNSAVNLNEEGVYPVTYTATDLAGNSSSVTISLTVKKDAYSEETVNAFADAALAKIIGPNMTGMEKVSAIYYYVRSQLSYINTSEKGDWVKSAYQGFTQGKGDCYVYASMAKALLIRAGIANMDIHQIPGKTTHYWSLVDVGDGWYHYDTTPRKDGTTFLMWTDEELMNYSNSHNNSHLYDKSLYPAIN